MGFTDCKRFHIWSLKLVTEAERSRKDGRGARAIVMWCNQPINQFEPSYVMSAPLLSAVHTDSHHRFTSTCARLCAFGMTSDRDSALCTSRGRVLHASDSISNLLCSALCASPRENNYSIQIWTTYLMLKGGVNPFVLRRLVLQLVADNSTLCCAYDGHGVHHVSTVTPFR